MKPMLARLVRQLPGEGYIYEPKWDGFRAIVEKRGGEITIHSRNGRGLARYFPEVVDAFRALAVDVVLDGEIVVMGSRGLDFAALMSRLHPTKTRVDRLRNETPACFIAFDAIAVRDEDYTTRDFLERRAFLETLPTSTHLTVTPATTDVSRAEAWFQSFVGGGLDGVVAKHPTLKYLPDRRAMIKVKRQRTLDCVVAGFRSYGDQPIVGSLLLGLYRGDDLVHLGVTSQFTMRQRNELLRELWPLVTKLPGHPWERGFGLERSPLGRLKGSAGRWSPEMEPDWIPLRPERVCEVSYDTLDGHRLRYPARFARWRVDRDPRSCTFDQLGDEAPDIRALLSP